MSEIQVQAQCPHCGEDVVIGANVDPSMLMPAVRGRLQPIGNIAVYKVTSEDMKAFITQKAKKYCSEVKIEVVPRYCEKKRRRETEPHRSYASLRIAFSEHILEKKDELGWYGKIGESSDNMRIQQSMFQNLIQLYRYNPKDIDAWVKSYKNLEELEEGLGMTESYINDLRMYSRPQRVKTTGTDSWIIFAAAAENVLRDMLTDPKTGRVPGRIQIQDVYPISKDNVEFVVYLHPAEMNLRENPHVRQILMGEEKPKK